ncbi:MAG: energy-coupled thiamine transporter ThiT [Clostridia bacterium]|nr:energy-coupled thiamine transporter ThiT [Clostridia bacterium]
MKKWVMASLLGASLSTCLAEEAEEAAAAPAGWFATAFGKMGEQHWYTWLLVLALMAAGVVILATNRRKRSRGWSIAAGAVFALAIVIALVSLFAGGIYDTAGGTGPYVIVILALLAAMVLLLVLPGGQKLNARGIAYAGISMAIAFVLAMIKLYRAPQGGTVTPGSLIPLMLFCLAFGPRQGLVLCFSYGLFQLIEDPYVIHPIQLLVDYPMAFGAVALCSCASRIGNARLRLVLAVLIGYCGRYVMAVLSGVIFFAEYAGEQNAMIYSLAYNIAYMGPETVLAMLIAAIPGIHRLPAMMRKGLR